MEIWHRELSFSISICDISDCDAEEDDAKPRENREIVDGILPDVALMETKNELYDRW